jgi:hypothetical protein
MEGLVIGKDLSWMDAIPRCMNPLLNTRLKAGKRVSRIDAKYTMNGNLKEVRGEWIFWDFYF